jgi:hypothetical protein
MWLALVYLVVTLIVCGEAIFEASIFVGGVALIGYALCYFATATLVGALKGRWMVSYRRGDLVIVSAIAAALIVVGLGFTVWSGFRVGLFGVVIPGIYWAVLGVILAAVTTKKRAGPDRLNRIPRRLSGLLPGLVLCNFARGA